MRSPDRVPGRLGDGDDEHVALVHARHVGGVAQADVDVAARELVDARVRLDVGRDRDRRVVHQALADAGERRAHLDAQVLQMPDRPDAGAQQMGRRVDGAAGQDHLARPELRARALHVRDHADAALALEQQLGHLRVGRDRQVGALARGGIEIADGGRHAPLVGVGDGDRVVAVLPLAVLVGQVLEARRLEGLGRGLGMLGPLAPGRCAAPGCAPPCRATARRSPCRARPSCSRAARPSSPSRARRAPPTPRSRPARRGWRAGR